MRQESGAGAGRPIGGEEGASSLRSQPCAAIGKLEGLLFLQGKLVRKEL